MIKGGGGVRRGNSGQVRQKFLPFRVASVCLRLCRCLLYWLNHFLVHCSKAKFELPQPFSLLPPCPFGTKRIHYWTLKTFCSWLCFAFHHHVFILLSIMATFLIELPSCVCNLDPLAKCETCSCNSCKLVILWSVLPRPANVAVFHN